MTWILAGRISPTTGDGGGSLAECRVQVFFERAPTPAPADAPAGVGSEVVVEDPRNTSLPRVALALDTRVNGLRGRSAAQTDAAGTFTLRLPDRGDLAGSEFRFVVSEPGGATIGEVLIPVDMVDEPLVISVRAVEPIVLAAPPVAPLAATRRVSGRVVDLGGRPAAAGLQVLLYARRAEAAGTATGSRVEDGVGATAGMIRGPKGTAADGPVLVARTDACGYFFGEVPNERFVAVGALVAGVAEAILIPLEDGYVPRRVPLVAGLPPDAIAAPGASPCGAADPGPTPRTPTQDDIDDAPDAFSTDLGTGRCVQFNRPNRAIEEFDFYTVVRTTEPAIRGVTRADNPLWTEGVAIPSVAAGPAAEALLAADEATAAEALVGPAATAAATADAAATTAEKSATDAAALVKGMGKLGLAISAGAGLGSGALEAGLKELELKAQTARAAATTAAEHAAAVKTAARAARAAATAAHARARIAADVEAAVVKARLEAAARAAERAAAASAQGAARAMSREFLDVTNPVDWDSTPMFYEASTIAHGHLLHFKQTWHADGYSLGDLLYSLPLAPGQKKLVSVVDWERRERTTRTESTFASEELNAALSSDRDLGEVVTGALSESSRGGSRSASAGIGAGTGAAGNGSYQAFNFGALVGVSGGYGQSDATAWMASAKSLSSTSIQTLRDRTMQSASAVRGVRSSVVHTVSQGETVRATTEVVANHNHCHALTIQYFEVLRHLKLVHTLADVQECLFVPLPMAEFDRPKALRWRQPLETYLRRRELGPGFDAARRVETAWTEVDSPEARYADERLTSLAGELQLTVTIPLPPFPERPKPRPEDTAAETAQAITDAVNPTTGALGVFLAIFTGGASAVTGAVAGASIKATQAAAKGARAIADELYAENNPQRRYEKFHYEVVPGVVAGFVDQLELWALARGAEVQLGGVDFTLVSPYEPGKPMLVSLRATLPGQLRRADITQLIFRSANGLPSGCRAVIHSATVRYRSASFEHALVDDARVNDDIDMPKVVPTFTGAVFSIEKLAPGRGATLYTPLDAWEQRSPRTEDRRLAAQLVDHLNDHLEYYHQAIWWTMDPNRRYMLLDGYYAPNSGGRSVASVVENRLIGIVGNCFVLPVAHGNHLDPRIRASGSSGKLLEFYALDSPIPPTRVSLPTRGVFAEAVMGSCNACEKIDDSRLWRWEDATTDEPTAVEPLSTATRRGDPAGVQPSPFPTPIVAIQNAPAAPDAAGVRATLDALGRQTFADITGLAGTQANAAAAYSQALDTAFKFGKEASTLAQAAAMTKSIDKTMGAIDTAAAAGKIDTAQANKLRVTALEKLVGTSDSALSPQDVAERVDMVDRYAASKSIRPAVGQELNETFLASLGEADRPAVERVAARDPDAAQDRTAPIHIRGVSRLGDSNGNATPKMKQAWGSARSLLEAASDGIAAWKNAPHADLSDSIRDSIGSAALEAAKSTADTIPLVKAFRVGVELGLVFADAVGDALVATNKELAATYRAGELAGSGSGELDEVDVQALGDLRRWMLTNAERVPVIVRAGLDAALEAALQKAMSWATGAVLKAAGGVAKQLVGHYLSSSGAQAMLAEALDEAKQGIDPRRLPFYRDIFTTVVGLYVRQLEDPAVRATLAPLAKLGAASDKPLEKMLLATLASLLVDPFVAAANASLRKEIALRSHALVVELRAAGQTVVVGPVIAASASGVTLPKAALDDIELGPDAADVEAQRDLREYGAAARRLHDGAYALARSLGLMRQAGLVEARDAGDDAKDARVWNRYADELRVIGRDLHRTLVMLRAPLHPTVLVSAEKSARTYLILPRLDPLDYRKWQRVQYEVDGRLVVIPLRPGETA